MTLTELDLTAETLRALEALALRMKRTPQQVASDAVKEFVVDTQAMIAAVDEAKADVDEGRTMTLDQWRAKKQRRA
jgi:predicted transcriptional regulator